MRVFDPDKIRCWSCRKTFTYFGTESPMLSDVIWNQIASDEPHQKVLYPDGTIDDCGGFLCKDCMEKRLRRPLKFTDLKDHQIGQRVPFNRLFIQKYFPKHESDN